jgi:hypothetical protein
MSHDIRPAALVAAQPHGVLSLADLAYAVASEANRISAAIRDAACHCPGRAYVRRAWDLDRHRDGCPAAEPWVTAADALDVLAGLPPRKIARLILGRRPR